LLNLADARARARSWAAYVAGALVVLMRERGAAFPDGLSVLVYSAVPEGKGVSSSAAVEVAVMQARSLVATPMPKVFFSMTY
jgi:L-arabinokinase